MPPKGGVGVGANYFLFFPLFRRQNSFDKYVSPDIVLFPHKNTPERIRHVRDIFSLINK